jgi:hypothetical protein
LAILELGGEIVGVGRPLGGPEATGAADDEQLLRRRVVVAGTPVLDAATFSPDPTVLSAICFPQALAL